MVEPANFYVSLATREGFNASVRHINQTLDLLEVCNPKKNIADEINRLLNEKRLISEEVQAAVNMLLIEKAGYSAISRNLEVVPTQAEILVQEASKWKAVDLVIGYHHPDLGFIVVNPKNPESALVIAGFRKNELVILYASGSEPASRKNAEAALSCLLDLLEDRTPKTPSALLTGSFSFVPPKQPPKVKVALPKGSKGKPLPQDRLPNRVAVSSSTGTTLFSNTAAPQAMPVAAAVPPPQPVAIIPGQSKLTPLISVIVSNELFHNGNVEAWKRIIRSYNAKYPNLQVSIYYDGERIIDINTLFKWGKVKHGSCIQFRVAGDNIQDLAKLSRYFKQGASSQYEAFLHGSPDTVMNLF